MIGVAIPTALRAQTPGPISVDDDLPPRVELAALTSTSERVYDPRLTAMWLEALARPEPGTRLEAAEAFHRALREGWPATDGAGLQLVEAYRAETDVLVKRSLLKVFSLADLEAAKDLPWLDETDQRLWPMIDELLMRWDVPDAAVTWRKRVADSALSDPVRISAAQGLSRLDDDASPKLIADLLTGGSGSAALRIGLAEAFGIGSSGPELYDASATLSNGDPTDRVAAAILLGGQQSPRPEVITQFLKLFDDPDPAVVARAIASFTLTDPAQASRAAERLIDHEDAAIRFAVVQAIALGSPQELAVPLLADRLDDRSTEVRWFARATLETFQSSGNGLIGEAATSALDQPGWRGLEQAATLIGLIDHEPAAPRLIELLDHNRPEVRLATATALRRLAVESTLPTALNRAQQLAGSPPPIPQSDAELAQLLTLFGSLRYAPADALLRSFIPKDMMIWPAARLSAIWALGQLHAEAADKPLIEALAKRVNDQSEMEPEDPQAQAIAVLTIGRVDPGGSSARLRRWYDNDAEFPDTRAAARQALIEQGETLPPLPAGTLMPRGYFLEPLD